MTNCDAQCISKSWLNSLHADWLARFLFASFRNEWMVFTCSSSAFSFHSYAHSEQAGTKPTEDLPIFRKHTESIHSYNFYCRPLLAGQQRTRKSKLIAYSYVAVELCFNHSEEKGHGTIAAIKNIVKSIYEFHAERITNDRTHCVDIFVRIGNL